MCVLILLKVDEKSIGILVASLVEFLLLLGWLVGLTVCAAKGTPDMVPALLYLFLQAAGFLRVCPGVEEFLLIQLELCNLSGDLRRSSSTVSSGRRSLAEALLVELSVSQLKAFSSKPTQLTLLIFVFKCLFNPSRLNWVRISI